MKTYGNKEMTEKAVIFIILLAVLISGIIYKEDFNGHGWAAFTWFAVLILGLGRLLYFFIRRR